MLEDNINFMKKEVFPEFLSIFGWKVKEFKTYDGLAVIRADFYPIGHVLAISKKAVIVCEGNSQFDCSGSCYYDFKELIKQEGDSAYETFPSWVITVEKEWTIRKNGEWIHSFSNLQDMPYRKQVKC